MAQMVMQNIIDRAVSLGWCGDDPEAGVFAACRALGLRVDSTDGLSSLTTHAEEPLVAMERIAREMATPGSSLAEDTANTPSGGDKRAPYRKAYRRGYADGYHEAMADKAIEYQTAHDAGVASGRGMAELEAEQSRRNEARQLDCIVTALCSKLGITRKDAERLAEP